MGQAVELALDQGDEPVERILVAAPPVFEKQRHFMRREVAHRLSCPVPQWGDFTPDRTQARPTAPERADGRRQTAAGNKSKSPPEGGTTNRPP